MPSPTSGQAARPSSLPQTIPPQTAEFGLVVDPKTGAPIGKVTIDINWWLYLFNIGKQVLSAPGSPVPLPPIYNIAEFASSDVDPVDATQSSRMIANAVQLESQDIELPSPDVAALSVKVNNALLTDLDLGSVDAISTKQAIINALAQLLTDENVDPVIGGFSWNGTTYTLALKILTNVPLVANDLAFRTTTGTGPGALGSGSITFNTGNSTTGNTGQFSLDTGTATGSSTSGQIVSATGTTVNGNSGAVSYSSGTVSGSGNSGSVSFSSGPTSSGNSGAISFTTGASSTGNPGGISFTAGQSGGSGTPGDVVFKNGFCTGSTSGSTRLQDSNGFDTVRVTDDNTGNPNSNELGFFGVTPIYRPTTAFGTATFVQNSGNAVNDASTFDGYTLKQVVKALRSIGLLT